MQHVLSQHNLIAQHTVGYKRHITYLLVLKNSATGLKYLCFQSFKFHVIISPEQKPSTEAKCLVKLRNYSRFMDPVSPLMPTHDSATELAK